MDERELIELIDRIKNQRLELDLSYQDLSDKTGISKSTLQRYETGYIKKVPIQQIDLIAKALNVTPGYLMGWEEYKKENNLKRHNFGKVLKKLRQSINLTQQELADLTGLNKSTIGMYEAGRREPGFETLELLADFFKVDMNTLLAKSPETIPYTLRNAVPLPKGGTKIPVLGKVFAGKSDEAIEDVLGYVEISPEQAIYGDHFALQIKGNSMSPKIEEGDTVIVQKNFELHDGDIVILAINGDEATCKQVFERENGIMIQAFNPSVFPAQFYSNEEVENLPVQIIGKVIERRTNF